MAIDIFEPLKDLQGNKLKSATWYRNAVSLIADRTSPSQLFKSGKLLGRPSGGRMSMFFYDPKTKARLPYYDTFPLVLPLEPIPGGFIGMNFHYLPPAMRFTLLQRMDKFLSGDMIRPNTKYQVSYDSVKNIPMVKPTLHKYLYSNVRSQFLRINASEAAVAVYLPVQQFRKQPATTVWRRSTR
jgi:hypothetical protein